MHPSDQLEAIIPVITGIVDRIEPDQLDDPTPCRSFDVIDVLGHMIVLGGAFAHAFRGEPAPDIASPEPGRGVPARQFRDAMLELLDAERSPGAMQRTITAPPGEMSGETFARLVAFDGLVHGWDLAVATGQDYVVDDDVVAEVAAFARSAISDDMRDGDTFAAPTDPPAGASSIDRVAAFSGRAVPSGRVRA